MLFALIVSTGYGKHVEPVVLPNLTADLVVGNLRWMSCSKVNYRFTLVSMDYLERSL